MQCGKGPLTFAGRPGLHSARIGLLLYPVIHLALLTTLVGLAYYFTSLLYPFE